MSGAQLSNYATFLVHPEQAPLSIVLTSLSTGASIFLTPFMALFFLGKCIPIDAVAMGISICEIVVVPIAIGKVLPLGFVLPQRQNEYSVVMRSLHTLYLPGLLIGLCHWVCLLRPVRL